MNTQKIVVNITTTLYGMKCTFEPIEIWVSPEQQRAFAAFVKLQEEEQEARMKKALLAG